MLFEAYLLPQGDLTTMCAQIAGNQPAVITNDRHGVPYVESSVKRRKVRLGDEEPVLSGIEIETRRVVTL